MRRRTLMRKIHTFIPLLLVAGCSDLEMPATELDCSVQSKHVERISGSANAVRVTVDETTAFRVSGTVEHLDGLAIEQVLVGPVVASPEEEAFNYSRWSVLLPGSQIAALEREPDSGLIVLQVVAEDVCNRSYLVAEVEITPTLPKELESIEVDAGFPNEEKYLPSTVSVPALITVAATGLATGLSVELTAVGGTFLGAAEDGTARLGLRPLGEGNYEAQTFLTSTEPGKVIVTATALNRSATTEVEVAGPPTIFPERGDLLLGTTHSIHVFSDGKLTGCETLPPPGLTIDYLGSDVSGAFTIDDADAKHATLLVTADRDYVHTGATLTILCHDSYRQAGSGSFTTPVVEVEEPVDDELPEDEF